MEMDWVMLWIYGMVVVAALTLAVCARSTMKKWEWFLIFIPFANLIWLMSPGIKGWTNRVRVAEIKKRKNLWKRAFTEERKALNKLFRGIPKKEDRAIFLLMQIRSWKGQFWDPLEAFSKGKQGIPRMVRFPISTEYTEEYIRLKMPFKSLQKGSAVIDDRMYWKVDTAEVERFMDWKGLESFLYFDLKDLLPKLERYRYEPEVSDLLEAHQGTFLKILETIDEELEENQALSLELIENAVSLLEGFQAKFEAAEQVLEERGRTPVGKLKLERKLHGII